MRRRRTTANENLVSVGRIAVRPYRDTFSSFGGRPEGAMGYYGETSQIVSGSTACRSCPLTLQAAHHDALDEVALSDEEQDYHWHGRHQRRCHQKVVPGLAHIAASGTF